MWTGIEVHLFFAFLVLAFIFAIILVFGRLVTFYRLPSEFHFENRPSLPLLYLKGLSTALFRKQGHLVVQSPKEASDVDYLLDKAIGKASAPNNNNNKNGNKIPKIVCIDCRIDIQSLSQYSQLCGYPKDVPLNFIPPCYLETFFMPLLIGVAVSDDFKLSPLGLIHLKQTITQHSNINHLLKEPFDLECGVTGYRFTERGIEVDMSMKVFDRREMCVWQGVATLLSRDKATGGLKKKRSAKPESNEDDENRKPETTDITVPGDLGVQYAKASGDWNPHHLWSWSAKLLGFKKPIAHGMWTLSRCLTWLQKTGKVTLEPPFHIEAQFKRPLFMPGTSAFTLLPTLEKTKYDFKVNDTKTGEPQLIGNLQTDI